MNCGKVVLKTWSLLTPMYADEATSGTLPTGIWANCAGVTVSLSCRMPLPFLRNTGAWDPCQELSLALWNPFPHQEFVTIPGELSLLLGAA